MANDEDFLSQFPPGSPEREFIDRLITQKPFKKKDLFSVYSVYSVVSDSEKLSLLIKLDKLRFKSIHVLRF